MKFWKRVMAAVTAGLLCVGSVSVMQTVLPEVEIAASGETYLGGLLSYSVLYDGTVAITGCDTSVTEVEIPAEIDGMAVTRIDDESFSYCRKLTSITIPDSVTQIKDGAFMFCDSLTSVNLPDGVTTIEDRVFLCCENLTSVTIPEGVTKIGNQVFYKCYKLTSLTIPDSVTHIGYGSFPYCTSLTSFSVSNDNPSYSSVDGVLFNKDQTILISYPNGKSSTYTIPDTVSTIGSSAFEGCKLTSITIPDSVTYIGGDAFSGCYNLSSIIIPDSVTDIGGSAFEDCTKLTSITIPDGVTSIGTFAFSGCRNLASITLPDSMTSIGGMAFSFCTSLTAIVIPDSVTEVGSGMFRNCSALQSVTLPNQITELPSFDTVGFFQDCSSLSEIVIPESVTRIECNAFSGTALWENQTGVKYADTWVVGCDEDAAVADLKLGTKGIADNAFADCAALTTVTIPITVENIGNDVFLGCNCLADVYYCNSETSWNNNAWRIKDDEPLLNATMHYNLTYQISADGTAEVVFCAKDAAQVTIPETAYGVPVTSIQAFSFANCNLIERLVIPDGITAIRSNTFSNCTQLSKILIPDSVTSIDTSAFSACTSLSDVYYTGTMAQWQTIAIAEEGNEPLFAATIHCSDGDILLTYQILDDGTAEVISCARNATQVTIPGNVTSIGTSAFSACTSLSDIYYAGTLEEWQAIAIAEEGNEPLTYATIHCSDGDIIPEIQSGDIDGDNTIDADDAYFCLLAYAKMSLNQNSGLTDAQVKAADVDGDGSITANDAYYILLYYAKKSVGQDVTWEEIL